MYKQVARFICDKCFCAHSTIEDAVQCFHQFVSPRLLHDGANVMFDLVDEASSITAGGKVIAAFLNPKHQWQYVVEYNNSEVIVTAFSSAHTAFFMNYTANRNTMRPIGFYKNFIQKLSQPF